MASVLFAGHAAPPGIVTRATVTRRPVSSPVAFANGRISLSQLLFAKRQLISRKRGEARQQQGSGDWNRANPVGIGRCRCFHDAARGESNGSKSSQLSDPSGKRNSSRIPGSSSRKEVPSVTSLAKVIAVSPASSAKAGTATSSDAGNPDSEIAFPLVETPLPSHPGRDASLPLSRLSSSLCASCVALALLNAASPASASAAAFPASAAYSATEISSIQTEYSMGDSLTGRDQLGRWGGNRFLEVSAASLTAPALEGTDLTTSEEINVIGSSGNSGNGSSSSSNSVSRSSSIDSSVVSATPTPSASSLFCPPPSPTNLIGERFEPEAEITDQSVVLEAWEVVNETFFDARNKGWTPEAWAAKKEAIFRKPPRSRGEAYAMISSMLASLNDPYSRFVSPKQFAALAKYDVTGIGLNIGEDVEDGVVKLKVVGIVLGSPSQLAGVRQGDELVSVNGTKVQGMSAFDVSSLIQGPKGTPVTVGIRHAACSPIELLTMARTSDVQSPVYYRLDRNDSISPLGLFQDFSPSASSSFSSSVFSSVFPSSSSPTGPIGYIRLREFNAAAKRDVVTAIERLEAAGAASFVLDLQDNPGGLVQAGVEIAKLFLDRGQTVVYTEGRPGDFSQIRSIEATGKPLTRAPLTVLVNGRTASASEIVAGALHDNCRAVLVGSRTFGKGLIQSVYELNDGSGMVLTVGKYVTPTHVDIDGNGIAADFRRKPSADMVRWKLGSCTVPSS